jgi:hypothetical protein
MKPANSGGITEVQSSIMTFDIQVHIILQLAYGQLDRLLEDTVYAIREIGYDTTKLNRYRYEQLK